MYYHQTLEHSRGPTLPPLKKKVQEYDGEEK